MLFLGHYHVDVLQLQMVIKGYDTIYGHFIPKQFYLSYGKSNR
jgi:hypothetical protein